MIQKQKKWNLRQMKRKKVSIPEIHEFSLPTVLKSSAKFVLLFKHTILVWCLVNFAFIYIFKLIPNGWTDSLSILWLIAYYIYWSIFIRYILQHKPYFSLIRIFNGLVPASKIMFINISIYILLVVIPYIPLLMGFREKYLEFFENYMGLLQSNDTLSGKALFYSIMILLSPYTITRPYLALISSFVGKSRSIIDAYKKTQGYYWCFVGCAIVMSSLFALSFYIDTKCNIDSITYVMTFFLIYFNIVFMSIYKCFYKRKSKSK